MRGNCQRWARPSQVPAVWRRRGGSPASISWNAKGYGYNVPVPHPVKVS
jgi:hypothetical protein